MSEKAGFVVQYTTSFIVGVALAFVMSWRLTLILIAMFPLPAIALNRMWAKVGDNSNIIAQAYSRAGSLASQAFRFITTVMSLNGQKSESFRYSQLLALAREKGKGIAKANAVGIGLVQFFFMAVRTPVFYIGGLLILGGQLRTVY